MTPAPHRISLQPLNYLPVCSCSNLYVTYSLASGAFRLFFGRVADLFGPRECFFVSMALFAVFSMAAGFSQTPVQLNIFNGLMRRISAGAIPRARVCSLKYTNYLPDVKNKVFAVFSADNPLSVVCGNLFVTVALQLFNWRPSSFFPQSSIPSVLEWLF